MRRAFGLVRLAVAVLGAVALIFDFDYVLGFSTFSTINYFSYFTFQSNLVNVIVLGTSGILLLLGRRAGPFLVSVRALVTTYVIVSGVVFGLIVSQAGSHHYRIDVPWSSQILHFWIPAYVLLDWILGVGRVRIRWRTVGIVLAFPWSGRFHAHPRVDRAVVPLLLPRPRSGERPGRVRPLLRHRDRLVRRHPGGSRGTQPPASAAPTQRTSRCATQGTTVGVGEGVAVESVSSTNGTSVRSAASMNSSSLCLSVTGTSSAAVRPTRIG